MMVSEWYILMTYQILIIESSKLKHRCNYDQTVMYSYIVVLQYGRREWVATTTPSYRPPIDNYSRPGEF